jgi:hypothetical protein
MVTAGLLLSLDSTDSFERLTSLLSEKGTVLPGTAEGSWLPVAVEAADNVALREMHDWIARLPGVAFVDVVHVSFDDPVTISSTLST